MSKMNRIVVALLLALLMVTMCVMFAHAEESHKVYALAGVVYWIDEETNIVSITTFDGNQWDFEGVEDWFIGDIVAMVMDDMGTSVIEDDVIVNVRYCGWVRW